MYVRINIIDLFCVLVSYLWLLLVLLLGAQTRSQQEESEWSRAAWAL